MNESDSFKNAKKGINNKNNKAKAEESGNNGRDGYQSQPSSCHDFFLDAGEADCQECELESRFNCHPTAEDYRFYRLNLLPTIITGLLGMAGASVILKTWLPLIILAAACFIFWGLGLEVRLLCAHCPHYNKEGDRLKCWALRNYPKRWEYRPGPLSRVERALIWLMYVIITGIPLISMAAGAGIVISNYQDYSFPALLGTAGLLIAFIFSGAHMLMVKKRVFCSRCANFYCRLNEAPPL